MAEMSIALLGPGEALEMLRGAAEQFIDVRSPLEFESEHIDNSKNIPFDELAKRSVELKKEEMAILVCRSDKRAVLAAEMLASHGFQVSVLDGGIMRWSKDRLPLKEGQKRLSLE